MWTAYFSKLLRNAFNIKACIAPKHTSNKSQRTNHITNKSHHKQITSQTNHITNKSQITNKSHHKQITSQTNHKSQTNHITNKSKITNKSHHKQIKNHKQITSQTNHITNKSPITSVAVLAHQSAADITLKYPATHRADRQFLLTTSTSL